MRWFDVLPDSTLPIVDVILVFAVPLLSLMVLVVVVVAEIFLQGLIDYHRRGLAVLLSLV